LRTGAEYLLIPLPSDAELIDMLYAVVSANGGGNMAIRLTVTRGVGGIATDLTASGKPTILIAPRPIPVWGDLPERLITLRVRRVPSGMAMTVKSLNYLPAVVAAQQLQESGAREGIMLSLDGWVAEGTASNIFIVRNGTLITPPLDLGILDGVTRRRTIELARQAGIPVIEDRFDIDTLKSADECCISSTTREVMSVGSVDGSAIAGGETGPVTRTLQQLYRNDIPAEF
jgi:branched-chain amino acid aminotransferase